MFQQPPSSRNASKTHIHFQIQQLYHFPSLELIHSFYPLLAFWTVCWISGLDGCRFCAVWLSRQISRDTINPFKPSVALLFPLKMSENQRFSDAFSGCRNGTWGYNWLILMKIEHDLLTHKLFLRQPLIFKG